MQPPRSLPLAVSALVFTTLAIALPAIHLALRPRGVNLLFFVLPLAVLLVILVLPRRPALTHFAFPLAHLPAFLAWPELTGPRIYGGPSGLVALIAVLGAGAAYFVAVTPRLPESRARIEPLALAALSTALAPLLTLAVPALGTDLAPWASLTCLVLGALLAWWLVARGFAREVALPALDPSARVAAFYALRERMRPRSLGFVLAALASLLALGGIAFWYLWSPR